MSSKRASIEAAARAALDVARVWFGELGGVAVTLKLPGTSSHVRAEEQLVIDLTSVRGGEKAVTTAVLRACALHVWRRERFDLALADVLERRSREPTWRRLRETTLNLDEFGLRVVLCERQHKNGGLEAHATEEDVRELDQIADRAAHDLCDWDAWCDENEDIEIDDVLTAYSKYVEIAFRRYVALRVDVKYDGQLRHSGGAVDLAANIGLEALAERDGYRFLRSLWGAAQEPAEEESDREDVVRVDITVRLDPTRLRWPAQDQLELASGNRSFVDLSETTWDEASEAFASERELLVQLLNTADPNAVLIDLDTDELDEFELAELGPMDIGTCAATLALNAAGCPTITACSGHVTGYPYIAFWARPEWGPGLIEAAQAARVGLGNANYGAAEVFTNANDPMGLLRLADELQQRAGRFSALLERWRERYRSSDGPRGC